MKTKFSFTFYFVMVYLSLNFLAVIFLKNIRYLFYFHWLIIIAIFIWSIIYKIKKPKRDLSKMDGASKTAYLISQYTQNGIHVFFCYLGFFYLYSIFYLIIAYFTNRDMGNYYIISTLIVGFILALKETILQFSQCIASSSNTSFDTPKCDKHYYHYWDCVQNKTYEIQEEEMEEFM